MRVKKYTGYTSYSYLDAGKDYRVFTLARDIDRVPSTRVAVTTEQEQRVQRILDTTVVISLHDHPTFIPENPAEMMEYWHLGRDFTGYKGLSISGLDAVFDNMMDGS